MNPRPPSRHGRSPASAPRREYARMHTIIRRVCYVLLFGLVIEGALDLPAAGDLVRRSRAHARRGVQTSCRRSCTPTTTASAIDRTRSTRRRSAAPAEAEDQTTSQDEWGVQPKPAVPPGRLPRARREHKERARGARRRQGRRHRPPTYCDRTDRQGVSSMQTSTVASRSSPAPAAASDVHRARARTTRRATSRWSTSTPTGSPPPSRPSRHLGAKASVHVADVSDADRMAELPDEVLAAHTACHILVNNAGVLTVGRFADDSSRTSAGSSASTSSASSTAATTSCRCSARPTRPTS